MTPLDRYRALLETGKLKADPAQARAAEQLDRLYHKLELYRPRGKWLSLLRPAQPPKGIYLFGDVGRGKSALMDLFFASVTTTRKRRVHFNDFMAETHQFIHQWRGLSPAEKRSRPEF